MEAGIAARMAYGPDAPHYGRPEELSEREQALLGLGGMEGLGRLIDGEIAHLKDALARERSANRRAEQLDEESALVVIARKERDAYRDYAHELEAILGKVAEVLKRDPVYDEVEVSLDRKPLEAKLARGLINAQVLDDDIHPLSDDELAAARKRYLERMRPTE